MNLDAPDDLGIIRSHTGTPLLWERHGTSVVYTATRQPPQPHTATPEPEPQP